MPKNKGKGGKNRRRGKNENDIMKRELIYKEQGQEYAQVLKMLGNGRLTAFCFDGKQRLCHIRGKLRKKVWINTGDIILIGLRDYQDDKADVILKYNPDEARNLKACGQLPENAKLNEGVDDQDEGGVEFADTGALTDEENEASGEENLPSVGSEDESDEDEEEESEEDSDVDEERLARGTFKKPGARDRYGKRIK
ncbi:Eukaryotic translation initiation factor 1A, Y-chromosomal [Toxocara canis]|uniref:Eukaryotic translation initiation factor 4C n=1 Tax=Toxocara canis TaxID=6265 RepID=A0A0B2VVG7_TOXCA|nr:Eukaryotic translation initiation factor 1A, Y-chromosomal [Toxocara canis]